MFQGQLLFEGVCALCHTDVVVLHGKHAHDSLAPSCGPCLQFALHAGEFQIDSSPPLPSEKIDVFCLHVAPQPLPQQGHFPPISGGVPGRSQEGPWECLGEGREERRRSEAIYTNSRSTASADAMLHTDFHIYGF